MSVSVIIPTYNRADILRKTLEAYSAQSGDHQILELLVVDDGSKDHTAKVVEECRRLSRVSVRYLPQENQGLSAARNHGIRESKGELILFGDDDIIPSLEMVAEHISWHTKHPEPNIGVLGYVTWAPEVRPTPFMVWSGNYGPQFNFGFLKTGMEVDVGRAYFCNTTVKASFLRENGIFDETFRQYGWEDLELSYRLQQKGYKLLYNPKAFGYHYKYEKFEDTLRRMRQVQRSESVFRTTEAGKYFAELARRQSEMPDTTPRAKAIAKKLLKTFEAPAMPILKRMIDTQIPLPARVYRRVLDFYYAARVRSETCTSTDKEPREAL
jgi:glycosyltransferase involved in cell wall biosynthesis